MLRKIQIFLEKTIDKFICQCYNKDSPRGNKKGNKKMYFYEIKNIKTNECGKGIANNFTEICKKHGWKPQHCRCIWRAEPEAAY